MFYLTFNSDKDNALYYLNKSKILFGLDFSSKSYKLAFQELMK